MNFAGEKIAVGAPPRIRRIQTFSLALLVLSGAINYLDRGALAVANQTISSELDLSLGQMGLLLSSFSWSYAVAQLPVGALVDRFGARRLLGVGLIAWSLAQGAAGLVGGFAQFIAARIALGICEAPQFPSAARVVADWFPRERRGAPTGVFNAASPLGSALAPLLLTPLMAAFGWRWMFVIAGATGLGAAALWFAFYRDPAGVDLKEEERVALGGEQIAASPNLFLRDWLDLFRHRACWGMMIGFFGGAWLNWVYLTWLPAYLVRERHMSLGASGFWAALPFLCGFVGCLLAGWISDQAVKRAPESPVSARRGPVVFAMIGMAGFTVPAALVESNGLAIACISIVIFLANAASACSWALVSVAAPANRVGSLGALQNFGGFLGAALAPAVTGWIAQNWSFAPALLVGAGFAFCGALCYLLLVRAPIAR